MLKFKGSADLRRVVVLNPKGGSGKTTLAFNLAGYLASTGRKVALVDMDRQGSSTRWLQNRDASHPGIHGISLASSDEGAAKDRCVVIPDDIEVAVIDAPAGLTGTQLIDYTCGAHAILLPVLPSDLDIHAAARLVSELLLVAQVSRRNGRLAVVANRVNDRTVAYQQLMSFLDRLSISVVGTLRDTQNYVWAASNGLSIHEMARHRVSRDLEQWKSVTQWLENCMAKPLTPRDLLRPAEEEEESESRSGLRAALLFPAAAAVALLAASLFWMMTPEEAVVATPPAPRVASEPLQSETPQPAPEEPADVVAPEETVLADASDELSQKWQLSGIAKVGDSSVMIVSDRQGKSVRRIGANDSLDGWTVKDTGENYAVFSQDGEEVRLVLNDETVSRN